MPSRVVSAHEEWIFPPTKYRLSNTFAGSAYHDSRGGALFGIKQALGLPVRYIGTGEQLELLEVFEPEAFVRALLEPAS